MSRSRDLEFGVVERPWWDKPPCYVVPLYEMLSRVEAKQRRVFGYRRCQSWSGFRKAIVELADRRYLHVACHGENEKIKVGPPVPHRRGANRVSAGRFADCIADKGYKGIFVSSCGFGSLENATILLNDPRAPELVWLACFDNSETGWVPSALFECLFWTEFDTQRSNKVDEKVRIEQTALYMSCKVPGQIREFGFHIYQLDRKGMPTDLVGTAYKMKRHQRRRDR